MCAEEETNMTLSIIMIGLPICSMLLSGVVNNRSSSLGARLGLHWEADGRND